MCISTIVLTELLHGAAKSARPVENRTEVERFASRLHVLPFDTDAAAHAGDIRATLEREGRSIGGYDVLIAGHARSRGLVVITGNPGEFTRWMACAAKIGCRPTDRQSPPPLMQPVLLEAMAQLVIGQPQRAGDLALVPTQALQRGQQQPPFVRLDRFS